MSSWLIAYAVGVVSMTFGFCRWAKDNPSPAQRRWGYVVGCTCAIMVWPFTVALGLSSAVYQSWRNK